MVLCNLPYRLREIAGRIAKKCRRRKDRSLEAKLADIRNLLHYLPASFKNHLINFLKNAILI